LADAHAIASTGVVFGRAKVDWRRQSVLYLVVTPVNQEEAAHSRVLPVAFIMNGGR
jgi:hypothetical protein